MYSMLATDTDRISSVLLNQSGSTAITVVAAVASQAVRVLALDITLAAPTTFELRSNATSLTGPQTLQAKIMDFLLISGGRLAARYECAVGEALNIYLGAGVQISGRIWYVQE